jgi:hypothetical protein
MEEYVFSYIERWDQRKVLEYRLDSPLLRVRRRVEVHRCSVNDQVTMIGPVNPRENLDECALTCPIVANEAKHLTTVQR